jgi:predicted DNA-binding transcriptional regulator AlpA
MRLLRYKDLGSEKGIWYSRTQLRRISDPDSPWYQGFPQAVRMGCRVGWWEHEIDDWLRTRPRRTPAVLSAEEHEESPLGQLPDPEGGEVADYSDK